MKDRKSFPLRIDPRLFEDLQAWAEQDMRSVNGQIEFLLRQAVERRRGFSGPASNSPPSAPPTAVPDSEEEYGV